MHLNTENLVVGKVSSMVLPTSKQKKSLGLNATQLLITVLLLCVVGKYITHVMRQVVKKCLSMGFHSTVLATILTYGARNSKYVCTCNHSTACISKNSLVIFRVTCARFSKKMTLNWDIFMSFVKSMKN